MNPKLIKSVVPLRTGAGRFHVAPTYKALGSPQNKTMHACMILRRSVGRSIDRSLPGKLTARGLDQLSPVCACAART